MSGQGKTADRLYHWATDEMHFVPCGRHVNSSVPTVDDFTTICRGNLLDIWEFVTTHVYSAQNVHTVKSNLDLICRGNLLDIWEFVTTHVYSAQNVHTVKSNLDLKARNKTGHGYQVKYKDDSKYSQQRAEKMEKRRVLLAQLATAKTDVQHLSRELDRMQTEIVSKEMEYQKSCSEIMDLQRKSALLEAHSAECKADLARYDEYNKRLSDRLKDYQQPQRSSATQTIYFSKHGREGSTGDEESGLETACTKTTRETCDDIAELLQDLVLGQLQADEKTIQQRRNIIWNKMEHHLPSNSSQQLLHSLAQTTEGACHLLRQMTSSINLKNDAQTLRFKYEDKGQLVDTSSAPNLMKSVHQLIQEKQLVHIQRFTETQKSLNQAWRLDKRLEQLAADVNDRLSIMYAGNPGALDLAKKVFSYELELAATTALVKCLYGIKEDLQRSSMEAGREKEILYNKYQKIQDFKNVADQKQTIIRVLVRQNSEGKRKLDEQQRELLKYMQTTLCAHEAGTVAMTSQLKNGVINELDKFAALSLHMLRLTQLHSGQHVPIANLSINRFTDQSAMSGGGAFLDILHHLNFPLYKSPESLLPHVIDMKCQFTSIELQLNSQQSLHNQMVGMHTQDSTTIQHIAALVEEVAAHDKKQLDRILPLLQSRQVEATEGLQDCIRVKDEITAWWEQPAQHLTPWVRLDEKNLQQWFDKWTVDVTRLRQLSNQ